MNISNDELFDIKDMKIEVDLGEDVSSGKYLMFFFTYLNVLKKFFNEFQLKFR